MKMWSGRFRQPLDADFERWQRSFDFDRRLLREELAASSAHASALKKRRSAVFERTDCHSAGPEADRREGRRIPHFSTTPRPKTCITSSKSNWSR